MCPYGYRLLAWDLFVMEKVGHSNLSL